MKAKSLESGRVFACGGHSRKQAVSAGGWQKVPALLALVVVLTGGTSALAATRTWTGNVNGWFTNAANWQGNIAPVNGDQVVFPDSATRKTITNTLTTFSVDSMTFSGSNFVLRGLGDINLFINVGIYSHAPGTNLVEHRLSFNGGIVTSNSVPGSRLHLKTHLPTGNSGSFINIFGGHTFQGAGDIALENFRSLDDQNQTLTKEGAGTLFLSGTAAFHTGLFNINAGRFQLDVATMNSSYVNIASNATIAGSATVDTLYVAPGGVVEPGGSGLDVVNLVTLDSGSMLKIPFTQNLSPDASRIDLNGQLSASANVVGLELFAAAELAGFNGQTFKIINDTTATPDAFPQLFVGVPEAGYVAGVGQVFRLNYHAGVGNNDVVLTHQTNAPVAGGTRTWSGANGGNGNWRTATNWVGNTAPTNTHNLVFPGSASGRSITNDFTGAPLFGELRFGAPNYVIRGQPFSLYGGINVSNAAAARFRNPVEVAADQTFRNDDTLIFFDGLNVWNRTLTLTGTGQTEIQGNLLGGFNGTFIKNGTGTLVLSGSNSFHGAMIFNRGVSVTDATFPTSGSSKFSVTTNGTLQVIGGSLPGLTGDAGVLWLDEPAISSGNVKLTNTVVLWDLSASPGLTVNGSLTLSGAILQLTNSAGSLPAQNFFTNILVTGGSAISGTYAGLPENSIVAYGSNQFFVHYIGGSGNDLVLELIPPVATYTWDGGGADNYWLNRTNWAGNQPIGINANLVFPVGAARTVNTNGITPVFTLYNRIELRGSGYSLRGIPLTLADGILHKPPLGGGTNTIAFDLDLLGALSVQNDSGLLRLNGDIDLAGFEVNLTSLGDTRMTGQLRGGGRLTKTGAGLLELGSTNSPSAFTGEIVAGSGPLEVSGNFQAGTMRIQSGATLSGNGTAKSVTVEAGGRVAPGTNGASFLTVRGMSFEPGAVLALNLFPTNSTSTNRLYAGQGSVDLSNATLELNLAHTPQPGEHHVLVDALHLGSIGGNFAGLPESALIPLGGAYYEISYINGPVELNYYSVAPSANVRTWQGNGGIAPLWDSNANWTNNTSPGVGESALFPANASARTTTNLIVRTYNQLRFAAPNYEVWAPQLGLLGGIIVSNNAGARIHTPIIAVSNLVFDVADFLRLYDPLTLAERSLTVTGTGETRLDGAVTGTASLFKNGTGSLRLAQASLGGFTANNGTVELNNLTASSPLPLITSGNTQFDPNVTLLARFGDDNTAARAPIQTGNNFRPNGATLVLEVNYAAQIGDVLVLATAANPITNTFASLPEGATLLAGGVTWQISYAANGGKRITLTAQTTAPAPPTITGITRLGNGNIRVDGLGATNIPVTLEVSSNLVDWVFLANRSVADGTFQFTESNPDAFTSRFYRARLQ